MKDQAGRTIDYMRISLTDRCNLRCRYCMPHDIKKIEMSQLLNYEEIVLIAKCAVELGIVNFKLTGGEPLVRKNVPVLVEMLKAIPGVKTVTITTNGTLLSSYAQELKKAGLDGINKKIYPTKSSSRELSETDQKTMKIENLPGNLNEAIDYFEQSDWIKEVLGTEFCKEYAAAKKKEWLRYTREISAWEIEEYLYRI